MAAVKAELNGFYLENFLLTIPSPRTVVVQYCAVAMKNTNIILEHLGER